MSDEPRQSRTPSVRYSSERHASSTQAGQGSTPPTKPDFGPQSEYRRETFAQGPVASPDPADPLPVSQPQGTPPRRSGFGKGCLIAAALAALAIVVFCALSCSLLGRLFSGEAHGPGQEQPIFTGGSASSATAPSPSDAAVDAKDTWTVLFYLCGSNLESESGLATVNLQELASTMLGDKVTFAVEAGGSRRWRNSTIDPRYLTRYTIDSSGFYETQRLPSASMAETSTFSDFVSWGVKTHPADHYMLVLWDHGGGSVYGVCNDELFPYTSGFKNDTLTLTEISAGLRQSGATFDVIGFDTCLMATYETAAQLSPFADYLVASEEVEPGTGWDYTSWPRWLGAHTGATGAQLGAEICDTYYEKCRLYRSSDMATLSVVDLSKIDELSDSFLAASKEIASATGDRKALRALYNAARKTTQFGGDSSYNMVDLSDLMRNASSIVQESYDDVIADVDDAVVYEVHGRSRSKTAGLSVFYPLDTSLSDEFYDFLDVAGNVPYAQFAAVMFGLYNNVDWDAYVNAATPKKAPLQKEGIAVAFDEAVNDAGQLEVKVTAGLDDIAQTSIEMSAYLPDQQAFVYLGTDYNVNGDAAAGVFADNFYGEWMAIGGNWVSSTLLEAADDYNLYSIPVSLNGDDAKLLVRRDMESGAYEVVCACADIDETSLAPKELRALEDGDVVEFRFEGFLVNGEPIAFNMGKVVWSDDVVVDDVDLGEGAYLFRFVFTDVLGGEHASGLYVQDYRGGSITVKPLADFLRE